MWTELYRMNSLTTKVYFFVKYLIPVLVTAGIIFYLSDQANLGSWMSNPKETILRKLAHFTEYGILAFFVWRLFYNGWRFFLGASFWLALCLTTLFAGSDELHQSFVQGRNGSLIDVVVDFLSIFIILQVMLFFVKRKLKQSIARNIALIIVGILSFLGVVGMMTWQTYKDIEVRSSVTEVYDISSVSENRIAEDGGLASVLEETETKVVVLPKKVENKVPFMVQSPFAKWDELHEESCEEASLIMLKYYNDTLVDNFDLALNKNKFSLNKKMIGKDSFIILKNVAEEEIQKIVKYQIEKYGDFHDTDAQITKEIGVEYFKLDNLKIIEDFKIIDLKKELAQGSIILVPTAGRELKNPYFSGAGPLYHNLVITGYNDAKNTFITNDPGTRRGENYEYKQQLLYNAIHDFPGDKNKILQGKKRAVLMIADSL